MGGDIAAPETARASLGSVPHIPRTTTNLEDSAALDDEEMRGQGLGDQDAAMTLEERAAKKIAQLRAAAANNAGIANVMAHPLASDPMTPQEARALVTMVKQRVLRCYEQRT